MRETIKKQLEAVVYADLSNFDEKTNTYYIPKYSKPKYEVKGCYLIKVANEIVNNPDSVIATNWNHGTAPSCQYLKIYVSKTMGRMVYVDGVGYDYTTKTDLNYMWSGWLPIDGMLQLTVL